MNAEQGVLLLETLEAWIDNAGSTVETAGKLFIHGNTVRQRLANIVAPIAGVAISQLSD